MEIIKKCIQYLFSTNWYTILALLTFNLFTYIAKLLTYKNLIDFISSIYINASNMTNTANTTNIINISNTTHFNTLGEIFVKLTILQIGYNCSYFMLEKNIVNIVKTIFSNIVTKMINYKIEFFKKNNTYKISQLWYYLENLETLIEKMILELPKILVFICYYLYAIYNFSLYAVAIIIPLNIICLYILHPLSRKQYKATEKNTILDLETKNKLLEATSNIEYVKLNNRQSHEINKVLTSYLTYSNNKIDNKKQTSYISTISDVISDSFTLIIYCIGISYILNNIINPIELLYLAVNTSNFYYCIIKLKDVYNFYKRIDPKIMIIDDVINYRNIEDINKIEPNNTAIITNTITNTDINNNGITFQNVTFSYDNTNNVIKNANFSFKNNKINLLLGPNGSGKSTIIKLLLRLHDLDNKTGGNIYYNGNNIKSYSLYNLRKDITFISQDPSIFSGTVWDNIIYGNENVPIDKIVQLCEQLGFKNWLDNNKTKQIGFRGKDISGGEKKKIQLINAICKDVNIIIFDEPSNALDSNAIVWFIDFIRVLRDEMDKTVIIITHDMRLKKVSDHVVDIS